MAREVGEIRDESAEDRLYALAEAQGGYLNAQQAIEAGVQLSRDDLGTPRWLTRAPRLGLRR
jgi:hypothetical protein